MNFQIRQARAEDIRPALDLGLRVLAVELEGHGREDIHAEVNIERTVGWFTSIYPEAN